MLLMIGSTLLAPFSEVTFAHSFVADVLTSMPKVFNDVLFTGCIYFTGELFQPYMYSSCVIHILL